MLPVGAVSTSAREVRDSLAVELDAARPESRLASWLNFGALMLPFRLGWGDVLGRKRGWIPRRADEGGGGATVILIGGFPGMVDS